jgi:uncharacterized membrane protein
MATMPSATLYHRWLGWHAPALRQGLIVFAIGIVAGLLGAMIHPWQVAALEGWDATCIALLLVTWPIILRADHGATREMAEREDPGRYAARALLVGAAVASLAGVWTVLALAGSTNNSEQVVLVGVAVATVVLSWFVVNTVYVFRYAQLRFADGQDSIHFPDTQTQNQPTLRDFVYVAFTIGMTYQVSDTDLRNQRTRGVVLGHSLLAYLYGVVIISGSINLIAGLLH